jgi:sec-independent protein translocase protein TatB
MFEFDAGKLLIIGIVALIVIGPKELPRVMRQIGQAVGKMRRLAGEFQSQFMTAMREAEFADLKAEASKLAEETKIDVGFNPVADVKASLTEALQAPSETKTAEPGNSSANGAKPHDPGPVVLSHAPEGVPAVEEPPSIRAALEPVTPLPSEPVASEPLRTSA